jgi:3-dehydroquinate dehydratase-1
MKRNPLTADKELTKEHHSVAAKTVRVADLTIGEGIPKICMGLAAAEFDLVLDMHRQIREEEADLLEWRTDYLLGGQYADIEGINRTLAAIAAEDARPVVLTLRTESEGGQAALSSREYREIIRSYIMESDAKVIDIEAFDKEGSADRDVTAFLVSLAHENGKTVILSNHDFNLTPSRKEITQRMLTMQQMGADIPKVAYMPQSEDDVHTLLEAAADAQEILTVPFIALSMGQLGMPSRVCGGTFGSCITFGASSKAQTAPGQIAVHTLKEYLKKYY